MIFAEHSSKGLIPFSLHATGVQGRTAEHLTFVLVFGEWAASKRSALSIDSSTDRCKQASEKICAFVGSVAADVEDYAYHADERSGLGNHPYNLEFPVHRLNTSLNYSRKYTLPIGCDDPRFEGRGDIITSCSLGGNSYFSACIMSMSKYGGSFYVGM